MAQLLDYVQYLSREIGPRPAGTEEEQQAALYIAEQFQKDAGFAAVIDDFNTASDAVTARGICAVVTIVCTALAFAVPALMLPAFFLTLIAAGLYAAEALGYPIVSSLVGRGVSQNVVAKYEPSHSDGRSKHGRKIVLVAHYDSARVKPRFLRLIERLPAPIGFICLGAMALVPLLTLFKIVIASEGPGAVFFNLLLVLALAVCLLPVVKAVVGRTAAYSEGANDNAAGVGVLMETARRIGTGVVSERDLVVADGGGVVVNGENRAREMGLVPEGAELVYDVEPIEEPPVVPRTEEQRLASAKAALAAFTGQPGAVWSPSDISENLVQVKEEPVGDPTDEDVLAQRDETRRALASAPLRIASEEKARDEEASSVSVEGLPPDDSSAPMPEAAAAVADSAVAAVASAATAAASAATPEIAPAAAPAAGAVSASTTAPADDLPSWFVAAQQKAKRSKSQVEPVRSRYAEAFAAFEAPAGQEEEPAPAPAGLSEAEAEAGLRPAAAGVSAPAAPSEAGLRPADGDADGGDVSVPAFSDAAGASPVAGVPSAALGSSQDPNATVAMPSTSVPAATPSFMDPGKVQAQALEDRGPVDRTAERVEVFEPDENSFDYMAPAAPSALSPVTLPSVAADSAALQHVPTVEMAKQRAPLADAGTSTQQAAKGLLSMLPSISAPLEPVDDAGNPSKSGMMRTLRAKLPSLSGAIPRTEADAAASVSSVSTVGSFVAAGATGSFQPVGDELLEDVAPEDIYVDDADDSDIEGHYTESGAFAGPGYVEMPRSRFRKFLDRFGFGRKKEEVSYDETPQEWLEVEDSFDPRQVGRERGDWESFRSSSEGARGDSRPANEGLLAEAAPTSASVSDEAPYADENGYVYVDDADLPSAQRFDAQRPVGASRSRGAAARRSNGRSWQGGSFSRMKLGRVDTKSIPAGGQAEVGEALEAIDVDEDIRHIYQFRNPSFNVEVWFVALGSEVDRHDGMRAFLDTYADDLRGAIVVELDSLGAGELSLVEEEGTFLRVKPSSRMKRYVQKASRASGVKAGAVNLRAFDSACAVAVRRGILGMHLIGADGPAAALSSSPQDIFENIDETKLEEAADFTAELVKSI